MTLLYQRKEEFVMEIKEHPKYKGLLVMDDGCIYNRVGRTNTRKWTFGTSQGKDENNYRRVRVEQKLRFVHRLVWEAFRGEIPEGMEIDHRDRNRSNNALSNLRLVDKKTNCQNKACVDKLHEAIGCSEREDKPKYMRWYKTTESGKTAIDKANAKFWSTHKNLWFSDGKKHTVPMELGLQLLKLPVSERIWGVQHD